MDWRRLRLPLLVVGAAGSVGLTYLAVRDVDFDAFLDALAGGSPAWFAAAFGVFAASYAVRVARWAILFPPETRPPARPLVRALLVGEFFTSLMPVIRPGELARVIMLHHEARTPRSDALGTVVTERVHDTAALLVLLFAAVPFAPEVTWLRGAALLLAVLSVTTALALVVLRLFGSRPLAYLLRPLNRLPGFSVSRTEAAAMGILRGLAGLRSGRVAVLAFGLTTLSWLGIAFSYTLVLRGVGLELGVTAGILVAVATTFALILPSLPASIGVFEAATLVALEPYDVDSGTALGAAVVIHVLTFVPFLVAGPLALRGQFGGARRTREAA